MEHFEQIKQRVVSYQERCLRERGDSAVGVDWNSRESQYLAFRVIQSMGIRGDSSVLDVGCGLAHFYDYLSENGHTGRYTGVDISEKMIEGARSRLPHVDLRVADILEEPFAGPEGAYDFVTACGVFVLKAETPPREFEQFVEALIRRTFAVCRVGLIFNMLTSYVDYEIDRLYYADPARYFRFAKSLTRFVSLKHDYPAYFFTMGLYKQGSTYYRR